MIACKSGRSDIMYLLAQHIPDCNMDIDFCRHTNKTYLYYAVLTRNYELVDMLLLRGANPNTISYENRSKGKKSMLILALENEDEQMVLKLIKGGANINLCIFDRFRALTIAILMQNIRLVRLCLALGSEISSRDIKYIDKYELCDIAIALLCTLKKWRWVLEIYHLSPTNRRMMVIYHHAGVLRHNRCDVTLFEMIGLNLEIQEDTRKILDLREEIV
jgi:hypothetical protein